MTFLTEDEAKLRAITTVQQLADYLNVPEKQLRHKLRAEFPKSAGQGGQWALTPVMNLRTAKLVASG